MSQNLRAQLTILKLISELKEEKQKRNILKFMSTNKQFYKALKEICLNIIKGNVKVIGNKKKKLKKYKKVITALANSKKSKNNKKLIVQSGGWLWIIPVISSIIDILK